MFNPKKFDEILQKCEELEKAPLISENELLGLNKEIEECLSNLQEELKNKQEIIIPINSGNEKTPLIKKNADNNNLENYKRFIKMQDFVGKLIDHFNREEDKTMINEKLPRELPITLKLPLIEIEFNENKPIELLPREILQLALSYLPRKQLIQNRRVNKWFNQNIENLLKKGGICVVKHKKDNLGFIIQFKEKSADNTPNTQLVLPKDTIKTIDESLT